MIRIILFISIVILSLVNAFSQPLTDRFLVAHYDNQSGLPQNSVKDIVRDTDGFIWLSTEDGLVRYDGRSFKVYNKNHFQINSTRFRIRKDYFQNHVYIATTSLEEVLPIHHGNVYHSNETDNTAQWIDGTSYIFGNLDLAWSSGIPTKIQHLSDVPNRALQAGNGFFYVCSSHKISMYKYLQKQWEINFQSSDKNMFFILHHQLYYYTPTEGGWVFSKQGPTKCKTLPHKNGISPQLYWNEDEDQAFFSYNDEIYFVQNWNQNTLTWTQISDNVQLTKNRIHCMFYDTTNHILLLGSSTNGLFAVKTKNFRNISSGVLNDPNIYYSLVPYNDSTIATPDGYLISLTGEPTLVKPTPINQQLGDAKYIMVTDKNNNFWLKDGRSLLALNHELKLLHKYTVGQPIHYIFYNNTRLWLGFTKGIAYMDISDFSTTSSPVFIPSSSFLKNVSLITQDRTENLWIGSYNGIYKIHPKPQKKILIRCKTGYSYNRK